MRMALDQGLNLRDYLTDVDKQLRSLERGTFQDHLAQGTSLAQLHHQIQACDGILGTMQTSLQAFQVLLLNLYHALTHLADASERYKWRD